MVSSCICRALHLVSGISVTSIFHCYLLIHKFLHYHLRPVSFLLLCNSVCQISYCKAHHLPITTIFKLFLNGKSTVRFDYPPAGSSFSVATSRLHLSPFILQFNCFHLLLCYRQSLAFSRVCVGSRMLLICEVGLFKLKQELKLNLWGVSTLVVLCRSSSKSGKPFYLSAFDDHTIHNPGKLYIW